MKCKRCGARAEAQVRHHNAAFCRQCFLFFFGRQLQRSIEKEHMFAPQEHVLVAVSGGKDSLALWDALAALGYRTTGAHLDLGIGEYSALSRQKTERFARQRGLPLIVADLAAEGSDVPTVSRHSNRTPCAACGVNKRHFLDKIADEHGFTVLATGHNLDDEAARLLGNVLRWQTDHLARQRPVLQPNHERFARKVKPLFRISEYETAVYAFFRGIDYIIDECPNSAGATQLIYKDLLNRLEARIPGTKLSFVQEFMRSAAPLFARSNDLPPATCESCGMPSFAAICSFCRLQREVQRKREPRHASPPAT